MTILANDIQKAKEIINQQNRFISDYHQFDRIYPFTNENIKELFVKFELQGKRCLTVLGSGDQTLDMCLNGSNDITTFDINPLTKYYYDLKKAALLSNITINQYLEYFCYLHFPQYNQINKIAFNPDTFSKICIFLEKDSYEFWCSLYESYHPLLIRNSRALFLADELKHNVLTQTVNYLHSETNFHTLKERIKDLRLSFINEDIQNLPNILTQQYDFIYLSNIIQYIDEMYFDISKNDKPNQIRKLQKFRNLIIQLTHHLATKGDMIVGYIYDIINQYNNIAIYNKKNRDSVFSDDKFQYVFIEGVENMKRRIYYKQNNKRNDSCLIYTKNR